MFDPFDKEKRWPPEEKVYLENAERLLASGQTGWIANGRPEHAAFLIAKFFEYAKEAVRIFSGGLTRADKKTGYEIYANQGIIDALMDFLSKPGKKCSIILEEGLDLDDEGEHPMIEAVKKLDTKGEMKGEFKLATASDEILKLLRKHKACTHFMLMDERALRLETNQERVKAHVTFGETDTSEVLAKLFDMVLVPQSSTPKYAQEYCYAAK